MTDGIIKGTGNSRYLKSVANALALYPTHESLMEALAAGTLPIDLNGINPAGWNIMGDKLDKATLLTDALCTALGLATTATPTQAMEKLRQLVNTAQSGVNRSAKIQTGSYTGSSGVESGKNFKTIYFSSTPRVLILSTASYTCVATHGISSSPAFAFPSYTATVKIQWSPSSVKIYGSEFASTSITVYYTAFS